MRRVGTVVRTLEAYNLADRRYELSHQESLPVIMRGISRSLTLLTSAQQRDSVNETYYMINLVKFNRRWEDCLFQMAKGSPAGRDIIEMLPPSAVGMTRVCHKGITSTARA